MIKQDNDNDKRYDGDYYIDDDIDYDYDDDGDDYDDDDNKVTDPKSLLQLSFITADVWR